MIGYILIRFFLTLWIIITALCLVSMLSRIIFSKSLKGIKTDLLIIVLFPISIFSKEGRTLLINKIKEYK